MNLEKITIKDQSGQVQEGFFLEETGTNKLQSTLEIVALVASIITGGYFVYVIIKHNRGK